MGSRPGGKDRTSRTLLFHTNCGYEQEKVSVWKNRVIFWLRRLDFGEGDLIYGNFDKLIGMGVKKFITELD